MTRRTERLGEAFREVISELLERRVKDPRIGFVTVTDVRVTADLSKAHVYWSVLGDAAQREETARGLESAKSYLRTELGRQVRVRTLPELVFHYDDTYERARRIDQLVEEIEAGGKDAGGAGGEGG